jgi:hypothetical protein
MAWRTPSASPWVSYRASWSFKTIGIHSEGGIISGAFAMLTKNPASCG